MSSITSVTVLAPNGRRQVVKVTPNTTILQILEEVCKKQGFKPEEYELRHQNRALDLTAVIRFSGLPNLAGLEMAAAAKTRTESSVGLVLQLESGQRVSGDFLPTTSLWEVVTALAPADEGRELAVVYLRREISGRAELQKTTLRDLGLTGGRALLRLVAVAADGPRQQANVSAPLARPAPSAPPPVFVATSVAASVDPAPSMRKEVAELEARRQKEAQILKQREADALKQREADMLKQREQERVQAAKERERQQAQQRLERERQEWEERQRQATREIHELEKQIVSLGARDAVVFRADSAAHIDLELPDDFFEPTVEDARVLYRDLKAAAASLADAPLLTSALRAAAPADDRPSVLRVRFPDRAVLQASFAPTETVADVTAFVRTYLEQPDTPFYLFTTPPRVVLAPDAALADAGCARSCVLHFGVDPAGPVGNTFLRAQVLAQLTPPAAAALVAARTRGVEPTILAPASAAAGQSAASRQRPPPQAHPAHSAHPAQASAGGHVPKWFKPV